MTRKPRELPEMIEALARQGRLLKAHLVRAQTDPDYWGEVAGKLRLLIVERRGSNKALLFHVADHYQAILRFTARPNAGHPRTWDELLGLPMMQTGAKSITCREVICRWAEQLGGAHEDWSVDEMLLSTQRDAWIGRPTGERMSLAHANIYSIAVKVLENINELLDGIAQIERLETSTIEKQQQARERKNI